MDNERREAQLQRRRTYYEEHKEVILAQQKAYHSRNLAAINERRRKDRKDNPEKYRQWALNRKSSPNLYAWKQRRRETWRTANKVKVSAHSAVNNALRNGKLTKPDQCSQCGKVTKLHGHHHKGYAPEYHFDVIWLCDRCHKAVHQS